MRRLSIQMDHSRRFERKTEIIAKYENGLPIEEIASQYDISRGTVSRTAKEFGVTRSRKLISEPVRKLIIERIKNGIEYLEIQNEFGISAGYISGLAKSVGLSRHETDRSGLNRFLRVR